MSTNINNQIIPGSLSSPFNFGSLYSNQNQGVQNSSPATEAGYKAPNWNAIRTPTYGGIVMSPSTYGGLVSPTHPTPGTLPSTNPITAHTYTTAPDGTNTTKITYANPDASGSTGTTTSTGGSSNNPTPAPTQNTGNGSFAQGQAPGGNVQPNYAPGGSNIQVGTNPQGQSNAPMGGNPYINPLATTAQNGSAAGQNATSQTLNYGAGNLPIGQSAADIAAQYGKQIAAVGNAGAAFGSGQLTTGTSPIAEGNAAITANTTANKQAALAAGEQGALQGTAQQLTAQNQAAGASAAAGGLANTAQSNVQSGLYNAGNLAQPSPQAPGQTVFNPATGQYTSGGNGTGSPGTAPSGYSQADWNTIVGNVLNGVPGAISGLPTVLQAQAQAAAQAQNSNFNYNTAVGQATGQQQVGAAGGTAQAQNIVTGGTAGTSAANTIYQQATQNYSNLYKANSQATDQATQVQNILQSTGLNQGVPDYNTAINALSGKLGSTAVTQLTTGIAELQSAYTNLLSTNGQTPTGSEAQALAILNPNSSAQQIMAAIGQLQAAAYNKLKPAYDQMTQAQSGLNGGGSNTGSGGIYDY